MKQTGQGRQFGSGEPSSLSRYVGGHVTSTPAIGHPIYLTQSLAGLHPPFSSLPAQASGSSPHGSREYHPHHLQGMEISGALPHRTHIPGGLGIPGSHPPMHMPQHRRLSGHRVSLLRDIGIAGERERAESSGGSILPHSYSSGPPQHLMNNALIYTSRPNISMLGSLSTGQGMLAQSSTPPRHSGGSSQLSRPSSSGSLHQYSSGSGMYLSSGSSVKSEPGSYGTYIKEEPGISKSPMHLSSVPPHYTPIPQHHQFQGHQPQQASVPAPSKSDLQQEKDEEEKPAKEHLLQAMDKVDKEITKVQSEMARLERKKKELENAAKKPQQVEKPASPKKVEPKHRDLWQVIYAENKKKAESAQGLLEHLGKHYPMPLYNQPRDTQVYKDNLKKNEEMRPKLLAYFQKKCQLSNMRDRYLCARYDQMMTDWQKKTDKIENNKNRKVKETKVREFFEKQFPEIRKQREQQERFSRSGTRGDACRSEADFNEIVDGLSEQEHHEQHMRQLAVVPPMLLDRDERRLKFINNNGLVTAPLEDYKKRQELDNWSPQEKQIFKEKYIQNPKNFHVIASCLEKKSVADCVLFYYLSKKSVGYKGLVRKNTLKPRKPKSGRAQQGSSGQDLGKAGQQGDKLLDKDDQKKGCLDVTVKEEEVERIERPPSPRMTRSRNKNLNWTDEDISVAKEGFGKHGKDFAAISRLFANKTENQVKNFYTHYKKKHNLDQLISDGKKKKPNEGSRRTRTQVHTSESSAPAEEESPPADEGRPKSTDPQVVTEVPEPTKKRKKDSDAEKKDELKLEECKKAGTTTKSPSPTMSEGDSTPTSRGSTPVAGTSVSHIRTRRAAAAASTGSEGRSESAKRSSESSPVDEPAEKKAKKLKTAKDVKAEGKEASPAASAEKKKAEVKLQSTEKQSVEPALQGENKSASPVDSSLFKKEESPPEPASTMPAATLTHVEVVPPPALVASKPSVAHSEVVSISQTVAKAITVVSKPPEIPAASAASKNPTPALPDKGGPVLKAENDGDSSATCSADEEPNMQDVEASKSKHADSPYAFEDDTSESIKLETSRLHPHLPATTAMSMQLPVPAAPPDNVRPSSTHPPPRPLARDQEERRPQSLPPPPGALPATSLPIGAIRPPKHLQPGDGRPSSTPVFVPGLFPHGAAVPGSVMQQAMFPLAQYAPLARGLEGMPSLPGQSSKHIVGKVPDAAEVLSALKLTPQAMERGLKVVQAPTRLVAPERITQTIDLTKPSSEPHRMDSEPPKPSAGVPTGPRLPHYHPVPQKATSLQKDFSTARSDAMRGEDHAASRPHDYTSTDIASMRSRAAIIPSGPIPVSSLRFPMPSVVPAKDVAKPMPNYTIKKEMAPVSISDRSPDIQHGAEPSMHGIRPGQIGNSPQFPAGFVRPSLTTSSIPTKFVTGTNTSGMGVPQKQHHKPPEALPLSLEVSRDAKSSTPHQVLHPKPTAGRPEHHGEGRMRLIEQPVKIIPASRASIVKGIPIPPHEGPSGGGRPSEDLEVSRIHSPSPGAKHPYPSSMPQVTKPMAGSITTGLPISRVHESRPEPRPGHVIRTDIIQGRQILVQAPRDIERQPSDSARHTAPKLARDELPHQGHPHHLAYSRFPMGMPHDQQGIHIKSELARGSPTGSILAGTPVVKRKTSEDSNPNVSPSAGGAGFPGVVVSRNSPSVVQPAVKTLRPGPAASEALWHPHYAKYIGVPPDKAKMDERLRMSLNTPEKVAREPPPSALSPGRRHTPTGLMSQRPMVKQELPGSPRSAEDSFQRPPGPIPIISPQLMAAAAGNPDLLRMHLPLPNYLSGLSGAAAAAALAGPVVNPEMLEIFKQYGAPALPLYHIPGLPHYNPLLRGMGPIRPPSNTPGLQSDEGRQMTESTLQNDFVTASKMRQRNFVTSAVTVPGAGLSLPLVSLPLTAIGQGHLLASAAGTYPPLAYPPGSLPTDRMGFIPGPADIRSPFSPYHAASGRNSSTRSPIQISPSETSRSPIQRSVRAQSPDFIKQRNRSGESTASHHLTRDQNSPGSPYQSPRGTTPPKERYTPQGLAHHQSPHRSQRGNPPASTPYYFHTPSSSSPAPPKPYHPSSASPHHPSAFVHQYPGRADVLSQLDAAAQQARAERSSPFMARHSRTGSLDAGRQGPLEKARPDSAGPMPRSQPQSPHVPPPHDLHPHAFPHGVRQDGPRHSPKPQMERKQHGGPPTANQDGRDSQKSLQEEAHYHSHPTSRESPKVSSKGVAAGMGRPPLPGRQQRPMSGLGVPHPAMLAAERQRAGSPYTHQSGAPLAYGKEPGQPDQATETAAGGKEADKPPPKHMSSNPAEDLKTRGRAKMTAANLIDAIININYQASKHASEHGEAVAQQHPPQGPRSSHPGPGPVQGQPTHQSTKSSVSGPRVVEKPPTQAGPAKQEPPELGRYEAEGKAVAAAAAVMPNPYAMLPFLAHGAMTPDMSKLDPTKSGLVNPANRTLSFAEHSADVINECYRKTTDNSPSPVPRGSPHTPRSANDGMEPISPPEARSASGTQPKKPQALPPHPQQQPFHPHLQNPMQRFPGQPMPVQPERSSASASPRPPTQVQQQRPATPQVLPQGIGVPLPQHNPAAGAPQGNSSLEEIIRKALMNNESPSTSPELRRSQDLPLPGMPSDLFITHAAMMSSMPHLTAMPPASQPALPPQKPKPVESRKEGAAGSQSQGGEQMGGYMSALMFRKIPSGASPQGPNAPATQSQERQFYPAPRSTHTSSSGSAHSPATPSETNQPRPQAPTMLPQYEALSDSD